jgi:hypothetical protein
MNLKKTWTKNATDDKRLNKLVEQVSDRVTKRFKESHDTRLKDIEDKIDVNKKEFKKPSCEAQWEHEKKVLRLISASINHIETEDTPDVDIVQKNLKDAKAIVEERMKYICIADDYGWETVDIYKKKDYADDDNDFKRIQKSAKEAKQLHGGKGFGKGEGGDLTSTPIKTSLAKVMCFKCGEHGHYASQCPSKNVGRGDWNMPRNHQPMFEPNWNMPLPPHPNWNMHPPNGPFPRPHHNFDKR